MAVAAGFHQGLGSAFGLPDHTRYFPSNATLTHGDLVRVDAGELNLPDSEELIAGVVNVDAGATSASTAVAVNVTAGYSFLAGVNNNVVTFGATMEGDRFDLSGTTGAQVVNTITRDTSATAPSRQLIAIEYNPKGFGLDTDTTVGIFGVAKNQFATYR